MQCLSKLESFKIGNKSINEYNEEFNNLSDENDDNMKPTEKRFFFYYIKGLEWRRIHEYLVMKRLSKLVEARE